MELASLLPVERGLGVMDLEELGNRPLTEQEPRGFRDSIDLLRQQHTWEGEAR